MTKSSIITVLVLNFPASLKEATAGQNVLHDCDVRVRLELAFNRCRHESQPNSDVTTVSNLCTTVVFFSDVGIFGT